MKKRELEEREIQFNQAIDPDIMRLKLKKDIEAPLRAEIEVKDKENSRLLEKTSSLKWQLELIKTEFEQYRFDKEKELVGLKERSSKEVCDLLVENSNL